MDEKQSKKVRDYIFQGTWTLHDMCGCCCASGNDEAIIDLPVRDLDEQERREAQLIILSDFGIFADAVFSESMGNVGVLRIVGAHDIYATQKGKTPFKIVKRPRHGNHINLRTCDS